MMTPIHDLYYLFESSLMELSDVNYMSVFIMLFMSVLQHFVKSIIVFWIGLAIVWVMGGFSCWCSIGVVGKEIRIGFMSEFMVRSIIW